MDITNWRLEDLTRWHGYEALLTQLGGDALAQDVTDQRAALTQLQSALHGEDGALFLRYADAVSDAAWAREQAVVQATLCFGVGLGAALARCPTQPPRDVAQTALAAVGAVLGTGLPLADAADAARAAVAAVELTWQLGLGGEAPQTSDVPGGSIPK